MVELATVCGLGALAVDVLPANLPKRGTNTRQHNPTRGTSRRSREEAEKAGEGSREGASVVWHVGHGLVDHVGVGGGDSRKRGREGGGDDGGGSVGCAEEDGEGAPHDGRPVEVDVDHVVTALRDDVGDGVGAIAVVLDCTFEVVAADASCWGDADADARAAGWDPARVPVLGDDGEGGGGTSGTTSDAGAGGGGLGGVDWTGRGMGAVVVVVVCVGVGVPRGLGRGRGAVEVVVLVGVVGGGCGEGLEGGVEGGLGGGGGLGLGLELGLLGLAHPDGLGSRHARRGRSTGLGFGFGLEPGGGGFDSIRLWGGEGR